MKSYITERVDWLEKEFLTDPRPLLYDLVYLREKLKRIKDLTPSLIYEGLIEYIDAEGLPDPDVKDFIRGCISLAEISASPGEDGQPGVLVHIETKEVL